MNRSCTPPTAPDMGRSTTSPAVMCHQRLFGAPEDEESMVQDVETPRASWSCARAPSIDERPSGGSGVLFNIENPNTFVNTMRPYCAEVVSSTPCAPRDPMLNSNTCLQTPEVQRASTSRMTSGAFGIPPAPVVMCTPQIPASLIRMRSSLDSVVDSVNRDHRMYPLPPVTQLTDSLYVGGFPDEETLPILQREGIRYIINCCAQDCVTSPVVRSNYHVHELFAEDRRDYLILHHNYDAFADLVTRVSQAGEKVFVHCIAGVNRSATLCAAYLMDLYQLNPISTVQIFHQNGRMRILENVGFRYQLIDHYLQSDYTTCRVSDCIDC